MKMLNASGFPVSAAVTVMERLAEERLKHPYVDPGVFMDHPDLPERIGYMILMIREAGWPLHRKEPLHLLRTAVEARDDRLLLTVDGRPVWSGSGEEQTRSFLEEARRSLDRYLQMELLPSDIALAQDGGNPSLRVGLGLIAREKDLPKGMESLKAFSENLRKALVDAQKAHPMGRYFL